VWRARIVLLSADRVGTLTIQRQTGKSKPTIWHWQGRFMAAGCGGLLRDATRPGRKKRLPAATIERVVAMTLGEPSGRRRIGLVGRWPRLPASAIAACSGSGRHSV
jgi:hypothetical protein